MDLPLTGSDKSDEKELIRIDTGKIQVNISGRLIQTNESLKKPYASDDSRITIFCKDKCELTFPGQETVKGFTGTQKIYPIFFEQRNYQFHIEYPEGSELEIRHTSPLISKAIRKRSKKYPTYDGTVNFGNEIGYSEFVFYLNGRDYMHLILEIFPEKIDYKTDYKNLLMDITKEIYSLIFSYFKKTYSEFGIDQSRRNPSLLEFFTIIRQIFDRFHKALNMVLSFPHHNLVTTRTVFPSYKIKKIDQKTITWLGRHPEARISGGISKALAVQKTVTYDTNENRLIKFMLESINRKLKDFSSILVSTGIDKENEHQTIKEVEGMRKVIHRFLDSTFLNEIKALPSSTSMSLVFMMAPGYRELYKYYLELCHGLSIEGNVFHLSLKDLAVLYEYWCFIKLNCILRDKQYDLDSNNLFQVSRKGITVNLTKGKESRMVYHTSHNDTITLHYNLSCPTSTLPQKPDNVLSLTKSKYNSKNNYESYEYIFDAKYRIDIPGTEKDEYEYQLGNGEDVKTPGPVLDTINAMHRYRDSILASTDNPERTMFGAYVLFPYANEEEYRNHHFYRSIQSVNVGGLPFLPGHTKLVEEMLDNLIAESSESAFRRGIAPSGTRKRLQKIDWTRDVLVGGLRDLKQYEYCIKHNLYYAPARSIDNNHNVIEINDRVLPIRYVALYQSKKSFPNHFGIYKAGEVIRCYRCRRSEISNPSSQLGENNKEYYVFEVRAWKDIKNPIQMKELGIYSYMLTTNYLMKNATDVPDLYIQNEDEWRIYWELKRMAEDPRVLNGMVDTSFNVDNRYKIAFEKGEIEIYDHNTDKISFKAKLTDFRKFPKESFKEIKRCLKL